MHIVIVVMPIVQTRTTDPRDRDLLQLFPSVKTSFLSIFLRGGQAYGRKHNKSYTRLFISKPS